MAEQLKCRTSRERKIAERVLMEFHININDFDVIETLDGIFSDEEFINDGSGQSKVNTVNTGRNNTGRDNTGNNNIGHKNSGNRNQGNNNSGDRNNGDYNSGSENAGCCNSGYSNRGESNSGSLNIGEGNAGECNEGNFNTGSQNIGDCNTGNFNVGNFNTGDYNHCDFSPGCFSIKSPEFTMFGKPTDWTREKWINSEAREILEDLPYGHRLGIHADLREDTAIRIQKNWEALPDGDKQKIYSLPNFDPEIFTICTGVKLA